MSHTQSCDVTIQVSGSGRLHIESDGMRITSPNTRAYIEGLPAQGKIKIHMINSSNDDSDDGRPTQAIQLPPCTYASALFDDLINGYIYDSSSTMTTGVHKTRKQKTESLLSKDFFGTIKGASPWHAFGCHIRVIDMQCDRNVIVIMQSNLMAKNVLVYNNRSICNHLLIFLQNKRKKLFFFHLLWLKKKE